jgi:hypothetical protein
MTEASFMEQNGYVALENLKNWNTLCFVSDEYGFFKGNYAKMIFS